MRVTVYARPGCHPCQATKRNLEAVGVVFEEADAATHRDHLAFLGFTAAPVVVVHRSDRAVTAWCGFRPDLIRENLVEVSN